MQIEAIKYTQGMLDSLKDKSGCSVMYLLAEDFPKETIDLIYKNRINELQGTLGVASLGSPIEYEKLELRAKPKDITIEVFNRGIMLMTTDDPRIVRMHQVLCQIVKVRDKLSSL